MSETWIYAFQDSRYERGIKVGFSRSAKASEAWYAAPSYSCEHHTTVTPAVLGSFRPAPRREMFSLPLSWI